MKKFLFLILALGCFLPAGAQSVNANYDRNALTVIAVHHNDRYDAMSDAYLKAYFPGGEKFDDNMVNTRYITVNYPRFEKREDTNVSSYLREHGSMDLQFLLGKEDVPRQIVAKWFNRAPGGLMNMNLINKRADYNATDQTYNIATAQALGEYLLHGDGVKLVDNSYILVVDHSVPVRTEDSKNIDGKVDKITYSTQAIGYLFKLSFEDIQRQAVYDQWIYPEDDQATKEAKKAGFERIFFPISLVNTGDAFCSSSIDPTRNSDETRALRDAIWECSGALINTFEKEVEAWKVKTTIYKTHPIVSKVGAKEGIKNMSRFEVLEYLLDEEGNVSTRRKGFVRATTVANNTSTSKGHSATSQFYQIAGTKLEPGMLLKEKQSLNLDAKALYYGGASKGFGAEADMAFSMSDAGSCSHFRVGATFFPYKAGTQGPVDETGTYYQLTQDITSIAIRMGYGYGIRPFRQLEVIPVAYLLADGLSHRERSSSSDNSDEAAKKAAMREIGWGLEAGVDANITIFYPVKLNAGAYYSLPLLGGADWQVYKAALEQIGQSRKGLTWRAGLVFEF